MAPRKTNLRWATAFTAIIAINVTLAQVPVVFKEDTKTCHPECTKHGNCNGETGQCDCPFGLAGPACTERLFPACHSSHEADTLPHIGTWYPKNCYCAKQLLANPYSCPKYEHGDARAFCLYEILMEKDLLCYRYKSLPESAQLSDSPPMDHPDLEWVRMAPYPNLNERVLTGEEVPKEYKTPDQGTWRPLTECPGNCSHRGWCQVHGGNQEGQHTQDDKPWCYCHSYFSGESCERAENYHCYRNCSGVGTCLSGWCHCQPGYWGHGCTRRKAYSSTVGWRPNHADMKIYVYDLPNIIVHRKAGDPWALIDAMYNAELEFTEQLLGDWGVRTENPWEATLFYVPMFTYWYTGNVGNTYHIMQHVTHHLQRMAPFFNLTGGRNHIMWATNDRGVCGLAGAPPEVQHSIKLVHFGQSPRRSHYLPSHLAGAGAGSGISLPQPGHRFEEFPEFNAGNVVAESEQCYGPEKDVVAPNVVPLTPSWYDQVWNTTFLSDGSRVVTRRPDAPARTTTLFFGGYSKPDMTYSQGVRQALNKMFGPGGKYDPQSPNARKDIVIMGPPPNTFTELMKSKFCLAPMGGGWGIRLSKAMLLGCVPVIVQDHIYQPFWDVVPFEDFSLRISRHDLHQLVDLLDMITPQQLERLQAGVENYHRAFIWEAHYGGLAYNYTVTALKHRALNMWSGNYHHHRSSRRHHRHQRHRSK